MTSQKDQIQSLINDIERALSAQQSNKSWIRSSDVEPQRVALAQAQEYLKSLQQTFDAPEGWGPVNPQTGQFGQFSGGGTKLSHDEADGVVGQTAEHVLQALLTEMKYLKSSALEPLRLEMNELRSERDRLQSEVKSLDQQREAASNSLIAIGNSETGSEIGSRTSSGTVSGTGSAVSEEQLNDFLTALMGRLQENLTAQVGQTLNQLESDHAAAIARLATDEEEVLQLRSSGQIEELRQLQGRSDQLLVNIDSTLQRMFETLQQNINSYQLSLNEGLENMHSLGRQGEVIVRSLVDHLTAQLGQTTPPEPAFFPTRSAAVPLVLINEDAPLADSEDILDDDSSGDTVSSLDEILPDLTSDLPSTDDLFSTDELSATDTDLAVQPEDCIREDGTIDLDLLKLDIDRDEAAAIAPEDVMIDAAIADAQVAATESEDAEIEAKIMPTAESLYLADLTFDDLTVDPELSFDDSFDDVPDNSPVVSSDLSSTPDVDAPDTEEPDSEELDTEEPDSDTNADFLAIAELDEAELAAILPDLSEPFDESSDVEEAEAEQIAPEDASDLETDLKTDLDIPTALELSESAAESEAVDDSATHLESSFAPDIPDADDELISSTSLTDEESDALSHDLATELEGVSREAERTAAETVEVDLDSLTSDLEETVVFEAETPKPAQLSDAADPLDSALIPDQPDADDQEIEDPLQISSDEIVADADNSIASEPIVVEPVTPEPITPESITPESIASETITPESVASEPVTPEPATPEPIASETIASEPITPELIASEPLVAEVAEPLSPTDFDDDLDFYREEDDPEIETVDAEDSVVARTDDVVTPELATPELATPELAATNTISNEAAAMVPLLEPPFAAPSALAPPRAEPIDPFVAADLERSFEEKPDEEEPTAADQTLEETDRIVEDQPPVDEDEAVSEVGQWFLGIDIGTTGLSAVLINQVSEQVYPLCWSAAGDKSNRFRLPAIARMIKRDRHQPGLGEQIGEVGTAALQADDNRLLRHIKPLLKVGIPHGSAGEPWVQWSDLGALPLQEVQSALSELLKSLGAHQASCHAVGMPDDVLRRLLASLSGVVVGYPTNWPDTYSFNVREAILAAGLVARGEQVFFIEEAIAVLLSALPDPNMDPADIDDQQPGLYNCQWSGGTVVLSAGATLSEAAIINLPEDLEQLRYSDFATRSFGYAGDSLDQDIICQLLHTPAHWPNSESGLDSGLDAADRESSADGGWRRLGLNDLALPQAGEADRSKRYRLRQRLNASKLGRQAIALAQKLKVDLQAQAQAEVSLGDRTWTIKRKDLETKVFLPYIQRVNRQINTLLNQAQMTPEAVNQVICTGGSASLSAIARWLRQKFPNATIIQDTYSGEYSNSCSRVAYGLANLCHYPNVLDGNRHQYSDYFLLLELLRILPDQPLPAGGILHLLEQRGIDTQACQLHILALIEGHLPPGLVPIDSDRPLISAQSPDIPTYKLISELPLFRKQGGQIYIADAEQGERLRQHLENVLEGKLQTLSEPQSLQLAAETVRQNQ